LLAVITVLVDPPWRLRVLADGKTGTSMLRVEVVVDPDEVPVGVPGRVTDPVDPTLY